MKTKRETFMYSLLEFKEIEKRLEQRAIEGWRLKKAGSFFWTFEEAAPKPVHYSVVFFPKTDILEPEPSDSLVMMREYCERTGWNLVAEQGQMQIFCNEEENPVPIETEAWIQIKNIHETMKKGNVLSYGILFVNTVVQLALQVMQFVTSPLDWLCMGFHFYIIWSWLGLGVGCAVELLHYFTWYKKAKRMAEEEEVLYLPKPISTFRIAYLTFAMVALAFAVLAIVDFTTVKYGVFVILWTVVLIGIPLGASRLFKKWKVSVKWNRILVVLLAIACSVGMVVVVIKSVANDSDFIFRRDEKSMLQLVDFRAVEESDLHGSSRRSDSLFLFREEAYQSERIEEGVDLSERSAMEYTILVVKQPFIYNFVKEELMAEKNRYIDKDFEELSGYRKIDMPAWGAMEVYQYYDYEGEPENEYLICYPDRILQIDFSWEVTDEDINKVKTAVLSE